MRSRKWVYDTILHRIHDLRAALMTWPGAAVWRQCILYYLAFVLCGLPIGFASGLLRFDPLRASPATLLLLAARLLISPVLIEELIFRVLLLPGDAQAISRRRLLALSALSLTLFVTSHVVNGLLFHRAARGVFTNPWFLLEAGMIGAMCTATYLKSHSVWPGVVAHWLTVTLWIEVLGGYRLVGLPA